MAACFNYVVQTVCEFRSYACLTSLHEHCWL